MTALIKHDDACPRKGMGHSDAAKRVSDTYNLHRMADPFNSHGKWIAVALADGTSDQVLYDTKQQAILHQGHNEQYYAFVGIAPHTMTVCEAETFLRTVRTLYDRGLRLADPDHRGGGRDVIKRASREDQQSLMRTITRGSRPSNLTYPGKDMEN
jgi:hypothetical protein